MALQLTKPGRDVFAPVTAGGASRGADMGDAVVLTTEYEKLFEALVAASGGITLTDDVIYAINSGAGTANAVQATASSGLATAAYSQLITVNFTAPNTGPMTLSINGEMPRPLVLNVGAPIPSGYVSAGMSALIQLDSGGDYRLFSYGDASSIQAAVEALWALVEDAADRAEAAAAGVEYPVSYAPQVLSESQQQQARENIGLLGSVSPIVLVFSGQSNMANVPAYSWTPEPNLFYSNADINGIATAFGPVPGTTMGCAFATANEIAKRNPGRPVWVVNVSRSSTGIANWLPGAPDADVYAALKAGVEQLLSHLGLTEVDQFFWWQGENDAFDASQTYPADFETLYARLVAETWFEDVTPITIMSVSSIYEGGNGPILRSFNNELRQVVYNASSTRRFCDTSVLAADLWESSGLHLTAAGYEKAGKLACLVACDGIGQASAVEYIAYKRAQEVRVDALAPFRDLDLKAYLRAGRSYAIDIYVAGLMEIASGFRYKLTGPAASIIQGHVELRDPDINTGSADPFPIRRFSGGYPADVTVETTSYGAFEMVIRMTVVSPSADGFLNFCWAQSTATSDVTRVWGGSYLKMIEVRAT